MPNMSPRKVPMPEQDPSVRKGNFAEVAKGYTKEMAMEEAERCLQCKTRPCVLGCPVNVQIPEFVDAIRSGSFDDAYEIIRRTNSLPAVCGRVCPQESQCEALCVRGIKNQSVAIGRLERFVADWFMQNRKERLEMPDKNGHKVAVIGGGPAGLTCAGDLAGIGYDVTVFEAFHTAGGVLMYGIPEFRLPKNIVQAEIEQLRQMGVTIKTNMVMGKILSLDEMFEEGYEAIFVSSGAGLPKLMGIEGEELLGVYTANELLTRVNLMRSHHEKYDTPILPVHSVAVIGGGNVAMDAARSALRLGAKYVYILYRRSLDEMPARLEEVNHAKEEGVDFKLLTAPTRILGDENGFVKAIECIEMDLGAPDHSGRRRPVPKADSEFTLDVDCVVVAIGNSPNPLIQATTKGLEANKKGCLIVDESTMQTSREGIYAGGDIVTGAATVILAMGAGKQAAASIDKYIQSKNSHH